MTEKEPWSFTVLRTRGLHFMRPEKSWRPIITLEVDKHHQHEIVLGCDGQNPNLKTAFCIHEADATSQVEIKVWHRSQSKKKGKKRNLVASACHSIGELLKKQDSEPHAEVRLQCQSPNKKSISSRGKPQNGAHVHLKLRAPLSFRLPIPIQTDEGYLSEAGSSCKTLSDTLTLPPSPISDGWRSEEEFLRNQRPKEPIRPYSLDSGEESPTEGGYDDEKPLLQDNSYGWDDDVDSACYDDPVSLKPPSGRITGIPGSLGLIIASFLPQYTEEIETPPELSRMERILASFTMYSELKDARVDSQYEKVFERLQMEWTYVGGLLVALAAVDTAVFSISSDSIFSVDPYARSAIASSSIASGLGIACDAWFLLRYNWADLHTFVMRARDLYGSYFFFSLSARVPALCMFISAVSLMGFLGLVAYNAWPGGVIVTCFLIGLVMTLQFLVYGAHWCASKALEGGRGVRRGVVRSVGWVSRRSSGSSDGK